MRRLTESGIVNHLSNKYTHKAQLCMNPESQKIELQPLKLADLYGVFLLFFIGKIVYGWIVGYSQNFKIMSQKISTSMHRYKSITIFII